MAAARARGKKKKLRCCLAKGFEGEAHIAHAQSRRLAHYDVHDRVHAAVLAAQTVDESARPFVERDVVPLRRLRDGLVEAGLGVSIVVGRRLVRPAAVWAAESC